MLFIAIVGYLDYVTHADSSPATQIVVGGIAVVLILFGREILERTGLAPTFDQIPQRIRPILLALPPTIWFAVRDEGTSGAGFALLLVTVAVVAVTSFFGPRIDDSLVGFYAARDRTLPRWVRIVLAVVIPVLLSSILVHGSLAAIPVLFRGTTSSPRSAAGRGGMIVFAALLSAIAALLLLREREA